MWRDFNINHLQIPESEGQPSETKNFLGVCFPSVENLDYKISIKSTVMQGKHFRSECITIFKTSYFFEIWFGEQYYKMRLLDY